MDDFDPAGDFRILRPPTISPKGRQTDTNAPVHRIYVKLVEGLTNKFECELTSLSNGTFEATTQPCKV